MSWKFWALGKIWTRTDVLGYLQIGKMHVLSTKQLRGLLSPHLKSKEGTLLDLGSAPLSTAARHRHDHFDVQELVVVMSLITLRPCLRRSRRRRYRSQWSIRSRPRATSMTLT